MFSILYCTVYFTVQVKANVKRTSRTRYALRTHAKKKSGALYVSLAYIKYLSVSLDALELLWSSARVSGGEAALWVRSDSKHAELVDGGERLRVRSPSVLRIPYSGFRLAE